MPDAFRKYAESNGEWEDVLEILDEASLKLKKRSRPSRRKHVMWQTAQIEFEYESRNFLDHGHDPEKCDVVICWKHNWPECPENLEIVALSKLIEKL